MLLVRNTHLISKFYQIVFLHMTAGQSDSLGERDGHKD